jgi:hypothetical protein
MNPMLRSLRRFANASLAAILIAATPASSAIEAIAHARSADQPHHPNRSHFEDQRANSHSDHCFAGRTLGLDRFVVPTETVALDRIVDDRPSLPHRSRAPPSPVVRA